MCPAPSTQTSSAPRRLASSRPRLGGVKILGAVNHSDRNVGPLQVTQVHHLHCSKDRASHIGFAGDKVVPCVYNILLPCLSAQSTADKEMTESASHHPFQRGASDHRCYQFAEPVYSDPGCGVCHQKHLAYMLVNTIRMMKSHCLDGHPSQGMTCHSRIFGFD